MKLLNTLVCFLSLAYFAEARDKPNFLLFLADDCTWSDFGCYGNDEIKTPNIDRLAAGGMQFEHFYNSSPMCAPTRMSLFTGIHPVRNGGYPNHSVVYEHIQSVPHYLRPLGYDVSLIGKMHHAPAENFPFDFLGGRKHDTGGKGPDMDLAKIDEYLSTRDGKPFCLMVQSNQPHTPWNRGDASAYNASSLTLPPYMVDTPETREDMTKYYAEITYMDEQVGACMKYLKKHGLDSNTVVIFLSEQGSNFPHCKWTCYDSGIRSAAIFSWPGKIEPSISRAMGQYVDVVPTMVDLAGGKIKPNHFDGKSLVPVLSGKKSDHHEYVFGLQTTRGINRGSDAYGIRTVRDKQFRLIWNLNYEGEFQNTVTRGFRPFKSWVKAANNGDAFAKQQVDRYRRRPEFELYDMKNDPYEQNNLAENPEFSAKIESLKEQLDAWMEQQGDLGSETEMAALDRKVKRRKNK